MIVGECMEESLGTLMSKYIYCPIWATIAENPSMHRSFQTLGCSVPSHPHWTHKFWKPPYLNNPVWLVSLFGGEPRQAVCCCSLKK